MSKPYTLPISLQDVDHFLEHSVFEAEDIVRIKNIKNPFLLLFVLYQEYICFEEFRFCGNMTKIVESRFFVIVNSLAYLLPEENADAIAEIQKGMLSLFERNEEEELDSEVINTLLPDLRKEAAIWSNKMLGDLLNDAFEYTFILSFSDFEILKKEISKIAHNDPQRDYEDALKIKRSTDVEIDRDIVFREKSNGKKDPSALLLGHIGADTYKFFERLEPKERSFLEAIYSRRFTGNTKTKELTEQLALKMRSLNARKSSINQKVQQHLEKKLFVQDTLGNIVFPNNFSCMSQEEREKHGIGHGF